MAILAGTIAVLLVGVGGYYYVRATTNAQRLTERNLRELARISRAIEGRINNIPNVLASQSKRPTSQGLDWSLTNGIRVDLQRMEGGTCSKTGRVTVKLEYELLETICFKEQEGGAEKGPAQQGADSAIASQEAILKGIWQASYLRSALQSDAFDELFLVDGKGRVLLRAGKNSALRLVSINRETTVPDPADGELQRLARPVSWSQDFAGDSYHLFLQPVQSGLRRPDGESIDWIVGGLVAEGRFRAEGLAFSPRHLVFLGVTLLFIVLSLPLLRVALMGPRERLEVRHVFLLCFCCVLLGGGLLGLILASQAFYPNLDAGFERELEEVAGRLDENFSAEIRAAHEELKKRSVEFAGRLPEERELPETPGDPDLSDCTLLYAANSCRVYPFGEDTLPRTRYPQFRMIVWVDPDGMQAAKWTPRDSNTPKVPVDSRQYFQKARDGHLWKLNGAEDDEVGYYLESFRSFTTGAELAMLSIPFCWESGTPAIPLDPGDCASRERGAATMVIEPFSLDDPVLPAGVEFAVIQADGRTLFHSRPERTIEENLFEETDQNALLRAAIDGRADVHLSLAYMGGEKRFFVRPLSETPLFLAVTADEGHVGTVVFEALFVSGGLFLSYALLTTAWVLLLEAFLRRKLMWAWPDLRRPGKHRVLGLVLVVFLAVLVLQAVVPGLGAHPSGFLVPLQALGIALWVLTHEQSRTWRDGAAIGLCSAATATVLLLLSHFGTEPDWGLLALQAIATLVAAGIVWRQARLWSRRRRDRDRTRDPHPHVAQLSYTHTIALTAMLVGVLPGYLCFQAVSQAPLERLLKHHQLAIGDQMLERARHLDAWQEELHLDDLAERTHDVAFETFLSTECCVEAGACSGTGVAEGQGEGGTPCAEVSEVMGPPRPFASLWERLGGTIPFVTPTATRMRLLDDSEATWKRVERVSGGGESTESRLLLASAPGLGVLYPEQSIPRISTLLPTRLGRPTPQWLLVLLMGLGAIAWFARWFGHRVFLVGLAHAEPVRLEDQLPPNAASKGPNELLVCTRTTGRYPLIDSDRVQYISLIDVASIEDLKLDPAQTERPIVCIDFLDHRFSEETWNEGLLAFLEELVYSEGRRLFLLTSVDADSLIENWVAEEDSSARRRADQRWTRLLSRFVTLHVADSIPKARLEDIQEQFQDSRGTLFSHRAALPPLGKQPDADMERLIETVHRETGGFKHLRRIGRQIISRGDFAQLTEDGLVDQFRETADSYYRAIWAILKEKERLVVAQLASGAVVNPKSSDAIRRLLARGVLDRDPELRLMNESFARFVRETIPYEEMIDLERAGSPSPWQQLRFPLYLVLGAIVLFLFVTQQDLFSKATALVSSAALGAGALFNLVSTLRRGAKAGSGAPSH